MKTKKDVLLLLTAPDTTVTATFTGTDAAQYPPRIGAFRQGGNRAKYFFKWLDADNAEQSTRGQMEDLTVNATGDGLENKLSRTVSINYTATLGATT